MYTEDQDYLSTADWAPCHHFNNGLKMVIRRSCSNFRFTKNLEKRNCGSAYRGVFLESNFLMNSLFGLLFMWTVKSLISWNFVHCLFALVCTLQYKQLVHELRLNKGYEQEIYWFRLVLFQKFLETGISSHKHMQTVRQLAVCSFHRILILSRKTPQVSKIWFCYLQRMWVGNVFVVFMCLSVRAITFHVNFFV